MAALNHDIPRAEVTAQIAKLIDNLVNIKDETGEFLLRLEDGRVIDTKGWNDWEWTHGIGLFGLYRYWEQTGDQAAWDVMLKWFEDRFAAGTPTKNINTMSPFLTLANLYEQTGDQTYLPYLDIWAEWLMADDGLPKTEEGGFQHIVFNDENPQEMWDDTLMMSVLPLARIGQILGRPHYIEEAKRQFLIHIARPGSGITAGPSMAATISRVPCGRVAIAGSRSRSPKSSRCSTCRRATRSAPS